MLSKTLVVLFCMLMCVPTLFFMSSTVEASVTYSTITHRFTITHATMDLYNETYQYALANGYTDKFNKIADNTYYMTDSYFYILPGTGNIVGDTNKTLIANFYNAGTDYGIYLGSGELFFNSCVFINNMTTAALRFVYAPGSTVLSAFENCSFLNPIVSTRCQMYIINGAQRMLNNMFVNFENYATCRNSSWIRNTFIGGYYGYASGGGTTGEPSVTDFKIQDSDFAFRIAAGNIFDVNNSVITGCPYLANWSLSGGGSTVKYLKNTQTDTLKVNQIDAINTGYLVMQYGLKGMVYYQNNTGADNVSVNVSIINQTSAVAVTYNLETDNGSIPYTFCDRHRWYRYDTYPSQNYTMNISFEKTGYHSFWINKTLNDECVLDVVLIANPVVDVTENLVNTVGSFEYSWNWALNTLFGWANYTGTGGSGSPYIDILNPNPANGTLDTNFIQPLGGNVTTAIDVYCLNFTTETMQIENDVTVTANLSSYNVLTRGQTFNTTNGFVLSSIEIYAGVVTDSYNCTFWISECENSTGIEKPITAFKTDYLSKKIQSIDSVGWKTITFDDKVWIESNKAYAFILSGSSTNPKFGLNISGECYLKGNASVYNIGTWISTTSDFVFKINGVSYDHALNISWLSNSSGVWVVYGHSVVMGNGTVSMRNPNMTNASTQYFWNFSIEHQGSVVESPIPVTFTTQNYLLSLSSNGDIRDRFVVGIGAGVLCCIPVGMVVLVSKKKKEET